MSANLTEQLCTLLRTNKDVLFDDSFITCSKCNFKIERAKRAGRFINRHFSSESHRAKSLWQLKRLANAKYVISKQPSILAFQARSVHVDLEPNSEATVETDAAADTGHEEVGLNHAELSEETEPNSEATVETDAAADTEHEEVGLNHAELSEETEPNSEATVETDAAADTEHEEVGLNHAELSEETGVDTIAETRSEDKEMPSSSDTNDNSSPSISITQLFGLKAEEITEEGLANLKKFPFVTKSVSNIIRRTGPHGSKKPHDQVIKATLGKIKLRYGLAVAKEVSQLVGGPGRTTLIGASKCKVPVLDYYNQENIEAHLQNAKGLSIKIISHF